MARLLFVYLWTLLPSLYELLKVVLETRVAFTELKQSNCTPQRMEGLESCGITSEE